MNEILRKLNINDNCYVGNTVFKKLFYENATMNTRDKEVFKDNIVKIIWQYSLKEDNINIQSYKDEIREYEEIAVMEVMLVSDQKFKRIAEIIQIIIPYPLIIIFSYGDKSLINVAHKRINLTDEAKNTVEEYIYTEWIDLANKTDRQKQFIDNLDVKGLSFSNFYRFYCGVVDNINLFNASIYEDNYLSIKDKDADKVKELQDKIEKLDFEINDLKSKIKKEEHFNNKMKMNIEIKKLEEKRRGLIGELK